MVQQEAFLNKLATKLGRNRRKGINPPKWGDMPYTHLYKDKSKEDLIQQFIENLNALNTEVDRVEAKNLSPALDRVIEKFGIKSSLIWDDERLNRLKLSAYLSEKGIKQVKWETDQPEDKLRHEAATTDLGVTFADLGLAETGTLMLFNGGGKGRSVSLLPPVYLCLLDEDTIVPRLTQAMEYIQTRIPGGLPACINFITGPSRTGDIEMDLALGVHGPGKVHVILLKNG